MIDFYSPLDPRFLIHGRTVRTDPLPLFWTGSGIELETDASQLWVDVKNTGPEGHLWLRAELDGVTVLRQAAPEGQGRVCVLRGVPAERRRVGIYREQQPLTREPGSMLYIGGVICDGEVFPVAPRRRRLEFVGDSVTAGEGLSGPATLTSGGPMVYSGQGNYALEAGRLLDADVNIVALSGWGAAVSWDNNPKCVTPRVYRQVCSAISDTDGQKNWDFASWRPDAVVIHLGNNDFFALDGPAHADPETGAVTRFRTGSDGLPDRESAGAFTRAVHDFLVTARECNPGAHIVWAYGMFNDVWRPYILDTLAKYTSLTGDGNVSFLKLPAARPENTGSNGHPGAADHMSAARAVAEHLKTRIS